MKFSLFIFSFLFVTIVIAQIEEPEIVEPIESPTEVMVSFPDSEATFPGGVKAMMEFLNTNLQYPAEAMKKEIQGKVYVSAIIEADGAISKVEVIRGVSPRLDAEALRLMQIMPKWIPGEKNGKPIRTRVRLPISFRLM